MNHIAHLIVGLAAATTLSSLTAQQTDEATQPSPAVAKLQSVGPIAFAEGSILLVSDPKGASIYAFDIHDQAGKGLAADFEIEKIDEKLAALLGTEVRGVSIIDVAVNPLTQQAYVSVMRGAKTPVLLVISAGDKIAEVSLDGRKYSRAELKNAPAVQVADASSGGDGRNRRGRRNRNRRMESITDIGWVQGKVIVAGLSNEEFSSKLRVIDYPFENTSDGASVEVFHGAHGRFETRSPIRTFIPYEIGGKPHIVAAYTCTPLVLFPLDAIKLGEKIKGRTIAELGNRNKPLDMIAYKQDGKDYLLMANSSRGVMKIPTKDLGEQEAITAKTGIAGQSYEKIESMKGVLQLDKLDSAHALVLIRSEDGVLTLKTVALP